MNMNITTKVAATSSLRSNPVRLYACSEAQLDINISISAVSHGGGGGYSEKPQTQHPDQSVPIHEEERKHGWDSLSDDRKKQIEVGDGGYPRCTSVLMFSLQIGGGLLAGIAAIGAGYFAYKGHKKREEEVRSLLSPIGRRSSNRMANGSGRSEPLGF